MLEPTTVETELVDRAEVKDGHAVVTYSRTEAALADLRAKYAGATYDLRTTAGDKAARAARLDLVTLRNDLEKKRKELKAPALEFGKKIDSEAARLSVEILALESPIDAQIKADEKRREDERRAKEEADSARRKVHTDGIAQIAGYLAKAADLPSSRIAQGVKVLEAMDLSGFEEFTEEATQTRDRTVAGLQALHAKAKAREDEEVRLTAQREEQARIAAEQAETARRLQEQEAALRREREGLEAARREAQERADREAREKLEKEQFDARLEDSQRREDARQAEIAGAVLAVRAGNTIFAPAVAPSQPAANTPAVVPIRPDSGKLLTLGAIKEAMDLPLDAALLARWGFSPVAHEKAAKLFRASDLPLMFEAAHAHLRTRAAKWLEAA